MGHSIDIELKDVKGKPSKVQLKILDNMNNWQCEAYLMYPKDWDFITKRIEEVIRVEQNKPRHSKEK